MPIDKNKLKYYDVPNCLESGVGHFRQHNTQQKVQHMILPRPLVSLILLNAFIARQGMCNSYSPKYYSNDTIGFYCGTFDPPTQADNTIIRNTIHELKLDRLYIVVSNSKSKPYCCSIKKRIKMLSIMLEDIQDRVVIIAQRLESKYAHYHVIKNILPKSKIIAIVDENTYQRCVSEVLMYCYDALAIIPLYVKTDYKALPSNAFYMRSCGALLSCNQALVNKDYSSVALTKEVLSYIIENKLYNNQSITITHTHDIPTTKSIWLELLFLWLYTYFIYGYMYMTKRFAINFYRVMVLCCSMMCMNVVLCHKKSFSSRKSAIRSNYHAKINQRLALMNAALYKVL